MFMTPFVGLEMFMTPLQLKKYSWPFCRSRNVHDPSTAQEMFHDPLVGLENVHDPSTAQEMFMTLL